MASTGNAKEEGKQAENLALSFLQNKGYDLLERNYRYKRSEIDLIMKFDATIIFVEVKYRRTDKYGHPEEFVSTNQQRSIINGADYYVFQAEWLGSIRFDIIAVNARNEISHFEDAFY